MNLYFIAMLSALGLFVFVDFNIYIYIAIFIIPICFFMINLDIRKNLDFFKRIIIANVVFYFVSGILFYKELKKNLALDVVFVFVIMSISVATFAYYIYSEEAKKLKKKIQTEPALFTKREKDKKRIIGYFENLNSLGIDSRWGTGKTFVVNAFKKERAEEYEFIEIDVLTSNLNEMRSTLIEQFEALLQSKGILPKYANRLKEQVNAMTPISKITSLLGAIFNTSNSNSEILRNFREEVNKLDKKVLIIYEDLDRIDDIKIVKEIFAISQKLASDKIHVLYQYDKSNLLVLGFSESYLEKYLPYTMQLTPLSFEELVEYQCEKLDSQILNADDIKGVFKPRTYYVLTRLELEREPSLNIAFSNIRTVENMINELYVVLKMGGEWLQKNKETVISLFILKHYMKDIYQKLEYFTPLDQILKIKIDNQLYTLTEVVQLYQNEKLPNLLDVITEEKNSEAYGILSLFRYPVRELFLEGSRPTAANCAHRAEQIDRVIWKSLAEGASELTNHENAVEAMKKVLDAPKHEWKLNYEKLFARFYNLNKLKDGNSTIFKIGISRTLSIFESFQIVDVEPQYRQKLMEFYFQCKEDNDINLTYIQHLNLMSVRNIKDYRIILENFVSSKVIMNFNQRQEFSRFLEKYIDAISIVGIENTIFDVKHEHSEDEWKYSLELLDRKLEMRLDNVRNIKRATEDIKLTRKFIMKLKEIFECKINASTSSYSSSIKIQSNSVNNDFYEIIQQIKQSPTKQEEILNQYYMRGEINIKQIELIKKIVAEA